MPGAVAQILARQTAFEAIEHLRRFAAFIAPAKEFGVAGDVHLFEKDVEQPFLMGFLHALEVRLFLDVTVQVPTFLLEGGADGAVVVPAHLRNFAVDGAEALPALFEVRLFFQQGEGEPGDLLGDQEGEAVAQMVFVGGFDYVIGAFDQAEGGFAGFLAAEPFKVAGMFPVGEVLFGDRAARELILEDFLDVRLGVEPIYDVGAGMAVFDAEGELVAAVFGEAADFSGVGGGVCTHIFQFFGMSINGDAELALARGRVNGGKSGKRQLNNKGTKEQSGKHGIHHRGKEAQRFSTFDHGAELRKADRQIRPGVWWWRGAGEISGVGRGGFGCGWCVGDVWVRLLRAKFSARRGKRHAGRVRSPACFKRPLGRGFMPGVTVEKMNEQFEKWFGLEFDAFIGL